MSDEFTTKAFKLLEPLTSGQRAHCYVQLNKYDWPELLDELKPASWDSMDMRNRDGNYFFNVIWEVVIAVTSEFDRSRQWWREELKSTDQAHMEWWNKTYQGRGVK